MDNQFMGALKQVERLMQNSLFGYSETLMDQLENLSLGMLDRTMTDCDYLKLLELYARKYRERNQKKALRFCVLRIHELLWFRKRSDYQSKFPRIVFTKQPLDEYFEKFMSDYPSKLQKYEQRFRIRLLCFMSFVYIIVLIFFVSFCHRTFLKVFFCDLFLFVVVNYIGFRYGLKKMLDEQLFDLRKYVDPVLEKVDQSVQSK